MPDKVVDTEYAALSGRVTPFLEPGEEAEVAFAARSGMSPWWFVLNALPVIGWIAIAVAMARAGPTRNVTIVTTDRSTLVLSCKGRLKPRAVLSRGPRQPFGHPTGVWGKISVHGERYWVHRRYHGAVSLANELLADRGAPPASSPA